MTKVKLVSYKKFSSSWDFFIKIACVLIQVWTRSKYFHTELIIDNKRITSDTRYCVVIRNNIDYDEIKKYADVKTIMVEDKYIGDMLKYAYTQGDKEYDWKGIFLTQFLPLNKQDQNKWFCTEICASILEKSQLKFDLEPHQYNPGSFQKLF